MSRPIDVRLPSGLLLAIMAAAALAGCGKQGVLQDPPPLFGERARERYEAAQQQKAQDAADKAVRQNGPTTPDADKPDDAPLTTRDIKAPEQKHIPASRAPLDGIPNPLGPPISTTPPG